MILGGEQLLHGIDPWNSFRWDIPQHSNLLYGKKRQEQEPFLSL